MSDFAMFILGYSQRCATLLIVRKMKMQASLLFTSKSCNLLNPFEC